MGGGEDCAGVEEGVVVGLVGGEELGAEVGGVAYVGVGGYVEGEG